MNPKRVRFGSVATAQVPDVLVVFTVPPLPQAPMNCFARGEIITRLLNHLDGLGSAVLSGGVGIGKTTIALTILHHDRVKAKFGDSRHFMRCDNLVNSLEAFLQQLSSGVGFIPPTQCMEQLRPRLARRAPLLLVVDAVDRALDPQAAESEKISTIIEEICQYQNVSLLATSRMAISMPGFRTIKVETLSRGGAHDTFYSLCHLDRSPAIDELIENLDFHPLSIDLLAKAAFGHEWDEPTLLREWGHGQIGLLRADNGQGLEAAIESALGSPTIKNLGPIARKTLEAISAFPHGVEETSVGRRFPALDGVVEVVNVLCEFHLLDRRDGFVRILSPFRSYFLDGALTIICVPGDEGDQNNTTTKEEEHDDDRCNGAPGGSSPD